MDNMEMGWIRVRRYRDAKTHERLMDILFVAGVGFMYPKILIGVPEKNGRKLIQDAQKGTGFEVDVQYLDEPFELTFVIRDETLRQYGVYDSLNSKEDRNTEGFR